MTATVPTRMIALLGFAVVALAAFVLVARPMLVDDTDSTSTASTPPATQHAVRPSVKPAKPAAKPVVKPAVQLLPGLPGNLVRALQRERVVVAAVWAPRTGDAPALAAAREGARDVGAGFVVLNVVSERQAKAVEKLVGPISDPAVLVFKRPGRIAFRYDGFADATVVAQAAQNLGAR